MKYKNFINKEEQNLSFVCNVVDRYNQERLVKISNHAQEMKILEDERYAEQYAKEKDRITREMRDLSLYDPSKFNPPFDFPDSPYLSGLVIEDDNPKIGLKHYLFGKQGLSDPETRKQIVIDWREAKISKLYYEWEEGDDYEEDINGVERTGIIKQKISYGIRDRNLLSIKTGKSYLEKQNGVWVDQEGQNISIAKKEESEDHRLVDIVSLISSKQFKLITDKHDGCFYLTGGAGSGKTTVAIHRLSYLLYNYPEEFKPEKCLVVMFNRSLRDYVYQTSKDLLTEKMPVETFHSWADQSLKKLGLNLKYTIRSEVNFSYIKKGIKFYDALNAYLESSKGFDENFLLDLGEFYASKDILLKYIDDRQKVSKLAEIGQNLKTGQTSVLSYEDAGILLYLIMKRLGRNKIKELIGWHDHILIDEAQDFSLVELNCLALASSKNKSMTICADKKQQILDFVDKNSFDSFQMDLQKNNLVSGELDISYRSTKQIMALASRISGIAMPKVAHEGTKPKFNFYSNYKEALRGLFSGAKYILQADPRGLYAIICRYKKDVQMITKALSSLNGVREHNYKSNFNPGILISNVHQIKGLEFSGVIIWNPNQRSYPDTQIGRNLLYVAITRASKKLGFYCYEKPSIFLRKKNFP